jgi:hypothetical protein
LEELIALLLDKLFFTEPELHKNTAMPTLIVKQKLEI